MTVLTYGTYDLLHYGHVNFLRRAKALAGEDGKLIVGLSTDDFHENLKHKPPCTFNYKQRKCMLESLKYIDDFFPIARCFITENLRPTVLPEKCSFEK